MILNRWTIQSFFYNACHQRASAYFTSSYGINDLTFCCQSILVIVSSFRHCQNYHIIIDDSRKVSVHRGNIDYVKTTDYTTAESSLVWEPQNGLATLENKAVFSQGFYNELLHFCNCVLTGNMPNLGTLEFARDVMSVYEAALLSNGQRVEISQIQ